jgi:hypothetical protein
MSDGREERKEQEERRKWEEERKKRDGDQDREWERDGDRERRDSRAVQSQHARVWMEPGRPSPNRLHIPIKYGYKQLRPIDLIAHTDMHPPCLRDEAGVRLVRGALGYYRYSDAHNLAGFGLLNCDPLGGALVKHVQWK